MSALRTEGYAASARTVGDDVVVGLQLCQGHCPIQDIASEYSEFCEQETALISELLDVDVRRLSTMAAGAHVCTTHVPLQLRTAGHSNSTNHTTARQGGLS